MPRPLSPDLQALQAEALHAAEAARLSRTRDALRAVQAQIVRLTEAQPRPLTGWKPPRTFPSYTHPCNRCGCEQPTGQTDAEIAAFRIRAPYATLYIRKDGVVRAHEPTCDMLPQRPPVEIPPPHDDDVERYRGDNRGLSFDRDGRPIREPSKEAWRAHLLRRGFKDR